MSSTAVIVRLLLSAALFGLAWHVAGPTGLLFASVGVAALLSRVLIAAVAGAVAQVRAAAYRRVEGSYFAYHGAPIDVTEDELGHRWLRVEHVRRVVQGYPRDALLLQRDALRVAVPDGRTGLHVRADALTEQLRPARDERTQRFRTWVEREVLFPSPAQRRTRVAPVGGDPQIRR